MSTCIITPAQAAAQTAAQNGAVPTPYNAQLRQTASNLSRAYRGPLVPGPTLPTITPATPTVQRSSLLSIPIIANGVGDNQLISTLIGEKLIYELFLWNVAQQTIELYQGASANGILLLRLTNFPALTGFTLGFNGNFAMPHFSIDSGQPLVLNLSAGTEVDGFVNYRTDTSGNF